MTSNEDEYHAATNVEELFAQVTSVEEDIATPPTDDDLGVSLNLYGVCMGIMAGSSTLDLTAEQRTELNTRMSRVNDQIQQRAMSVFGGTQ